MQKTTYQTPELRDANDDVIQQGAFGKNTALSNATNDGWIDYVMNDLEALHDTIGDSAPTLDGNGHVVEPANLAIGDEDGNRIKNSYLKTSGGTVNGTVNIAQNLRMQDNQENVFGGLYVPGTTASEQFLQMYGGSAQAESGAKLTLRPEGDGRFSLVAKSANGANTYELTNNNSGALLWRGGELAPKASPAFTGTPTAPTPATSDNSTKIATTAYVQNNFSASFIPVQANAGYHNSVYRGKSLGTAVSDTQWAAIKAGTFADMFIGDYWTINSVTWRIAAFDYWLRCGDTQTTAHHVVIVPDSNLVSCKMNNTNITTGAYIGSDFYTGNNDNTGRATAISAVENAFGATHILSHRSYLQNAVTNGRQSAGAWYDSTVDLMNEHMVYGGKFFEATSDGTNIPNVYSIDKSQLPLFAHEPSRICNRAHWWLRSVVSGAYFAGVYGSGLAYSTGASDSLGIRPAFGIYQS